jgi:FAD synthase
VSFLLRLRAERKFESVDALKHQIALDVAEARRRLEDV